MIEIDHLVVAARTLDQGAAWVEERLGVAPAGGGKHPLMGTHNRLLSLGPGRFLEVIAVDPDAPPPGRARWFELDRETMRRRLAAAPALIHWVARTDRIEDDVARVPARRPEILAISRGSYRWNMGVPADGVLERDGIVPTLIQWEGARPDEALPFLGIRLERLVLRHPRSAETLQNLRLAGLSAADPVEAHHGSPGLLVHLATPGGSVVLGE
jgi:hypothetical protein